MIAFLRGSLVENNGDHLVVDIGGVGYRILVNEQLSSAWHSLGSDILVHTHLVVREDRWDLYGFPEVSQERMFRLLLTVSGVGPKLALGMLGTMDVESLSRAIADKNLAALVSLPGVGNKLAQKLVLELNDKVARTAPGDRILAGVQQEAMAALLSLGYSAGEIQKPLQQVLAAAQPETTASEIISRTLRELAHS